MTRQGDGALSGYRVLDLADEKGAFCGKLLAGMGAEVIKIERPRESSTRDVNFWYANAGKLDITLNLEAKSGRDLFKRLIKTADAVVESYRPGYLESLGLDYSVLSEINPRLIMASITNFGQSGPYRDYNSSDLVAEALGGQMYVCGEPDMPPLKAFGAQAYYSASIFAAIGITLALWGRQTTGKGQHIDISLQESVAATLDHVLVRYFYEGVVSKRQGSLHWNNAFRIFRCRDGYILLSMFQQWATLLEWLDSEGMAEDLTDKKWQDRAFSQQNLSHIISVLERWTRTHTVAELVEPGQLMRFPWAEITSIPKLVGSPQLNERGFFVEAEPQGKRYKFPGTPCQLSHSSWQVKTQLSQSGEHNQQIFGEPGLSNKEIEHLTEEGVV